MEPVIKKDIGGSVSTYHYDEETKATGSQLANVACTVYAPGGSELIGSTAITPETDGEIIMAIPAANAGISYEWCRANFSYDYDSKTYTQDVYFHIARTDFDVPFHYGDLVKFAPDLGDYSWSGDDFFARQRDIALMELYSRLINAGHKPWRVLNRSALNIALAYLWLAHVFMTLSKNPDDDFRRRANDYRALYEEAFSKSNLIESRVDSADVGAKENVPLSRTKLRRG